MTSCFGRAPDCLTRHACVPGTNSADPAWVFQRNILVSRPHWVEVEKSVSTLISRWTTRCALFHNVSRAVHMSDWQSLRAHRAWECFLKRVTLSLHRHSLHVFLYFMYLPVLLQASNTKPVGCWATGNVNKKITYQVRKLVFQKQQH